MDKAKAQFKKNKNRAEYFPILAIIIIATTVCAVILLVILILKSKKMEPKKDSNISKKQSNKPASQKDVSQFEDA